jgi:4-amino-4-deoxy-L-arabinose transferase-like glycosyltransferase
VTSQIGWLFILIIAVLPRLTGLNRFLIVDEPGRWEWAKQFFTALVTGNPAGTMIHGYPGVLPDWFSFVWIGLNVLWRSWQQGGWLGEVGLYAMFHEWDRVPQHLADQRLGVVVGNTLLVLVAYFLIRRAFGLKLALVSGVLIALDPFYLTDSRVNRAEAMTAGVVFVSLLLFILYFREGKRRWLLLSGAVAGLACLAKIQALLTWPILGLIALIYYLMSRDVDPFHQRLWTWVKTMAPWTLALVAAFCLAWPAMWVVPRDTLRMMYDYVTIQSGAKGVNLFFLGNVVRDQDPGPLFYPVAFFLRANPLVLLGLGAALWTLWQGRSRPPDSPRGKWSVGKSGLWMVTAFVLLYPAVMTLGSHKQDRYLLTIFPMVGLLAATGLIWLWERIGHRFRAQGMMSIAGLGIVLVMQALLILPYHPYYYPYFNLLAGDGLTAPRLIRIGWGEGLDQVAEYLNSRPEPRRLKVASRFPHHLVGFEGEILPLDAGGAWTRADYIVFYIHQVQREQDPGPGEVHWLRRYAPESVVKLGRIEYAWVYRNPITVPADPQISQLADQLQLFGFIWDEDMAALRLVWLNQNPEPKRRMMARLSNGHITSQWLACEPAPNFAEAALGPGEVVESLCPLTDLLPLPSGLYDLEVAGDQDGGNIAALVFPEGRASMGVDSEGGLVHFRWAEALDALARDALPASAVPLQTTYGGQVRLVGYQVADSPLHPGEDFQVDLFWQALVPLETDYTVFVHLFDKDETRLAAADVQHATGQWLPGAIQHQRYEITVAPDSPAPIVAHLDVGLYDEALRLLRPVSSDGHPLPWTLLPLKVIPESWPDVGGITSVHAAFDFGAGHVQLAGYQLAPEVPRPGDVLALTLLWQPEVAPTEDYTVFVQLLDPDGQVVAQGDGPPRDGHYPTSWWAPGEIIVDTHPISLPPGLPAGDFRVLVGLYQLADGTRLLVQAEETLGPDALILTTLEIGSP